MTPWPAGVIHGRRSIHRPVLPHHLAGLPTRAAGTYAAKCEEDGYDEETMRTMPQDELVTELGMKKGHARKLCNYFRRDKG